MEEIFKILKLGKKFPKTIRNLLKRPWRRWLNIIKLDKEMLKDLIEYTHLKEKEVLWLLKNGEKLNAFFWKILKPETEKEIANFYQINLFYIFELAYWHMTKFQREFRSHIIQLAKGKILDFGGGIGDLSAILFSKGFRS